MCGPDALIVEVLEVNDLLVRVAVEPLAVLLGVERVA